MTSKKVKEILDQAQEIANSLAQKPREENLAEFARILGIEESNRKDQTMKENYSEQEKESWVNWLSNYGAREFLDQFLQSVEGAESTCCQCGEKIYVDVMLGGGVPDWSTQDGDFGCPCSPDTNDEGTGGHKPVKRHPH